MWCVWGKGGGGGGGGDVPKLSKPIFQLSYLPS